MANAPSPVLETATFGGGCFWCLEALYNELQGVAQVVSGYAGGHTEHPTYDEMHDGTNGHAEVIRVTFDPSVISYRELLEIFYAMHDPTTLNRQGNDVGPQYRSIILYESDAQKTVAETVTHEFAPSLWDGTITTELKPLDTFWPAEDYHQKFYENNPKAGYCQFIINPKVQKFRQKFAAKLKN